jgi:hypothetical protein
MVSSPRDEDDRADLLWPHCDASAPLHRNLLRFSPGRWEMRPKRSPAPTQNRPNVLGLIASPAICGARYRAAISEKLDAGLTLQRIWQDLIEEYGYRRTHTWQRTKRSSSRRAGKPPPDRDELIALPLCKGGMLEDPGYNRGMSDEDLKAELERLKAENEQLKNQPRRSVSLKVSEKGGVSVYGLGRFPVTLYKEQWTKLLSMADEIRTFIRENEAKLKAKPE